MKLLSIVSCFSPAIVADGVQAGSKQLYGTSIKLGERDKRVKGICKEVIINGIQVG